MNIPANAIPQKPKWHIIAERLPFLGGASMGLGGRRWPSSLVFCIAFLCVVGLLAGAPSSTLGDTLKGRGDLV